MYPMDRIQQKHARQIDLLENLTAVIQDYPNPACIRDETGKFIFCNTLFHESFLTQDQSAEKWLLSQRDFCELISVTEMEAYRNEHTHLNLVEDVFIQNRFWTISIQSFLNGHRNIILWQFYDAAHVRHKDSYNQKTIISDDIRNIIRRMSDDSSVSSYVNDVFYLYSTGISHNAIARILNISISTSKKHASLKREVLLKRFGTRSATGKMVKLKLPVDVESLLIEASNRSGRSRSFEAVIRLKDHLHRYPKFNRAGNIYGKSLVKYLTMRLDDETNQLLIAAKNRSGWCKTDEAADRVIDHLIKFPDFYNSEIFREADKEEDITFNTL